MHERGTAAVFRAGRLSWCPVRHKKLPTEQKPESWGAQKGIIDGGAEIGRFLPSSPQLQAGGLWWGLAGPTVFVR